MVARVVDGLVTRICIGVPPACSSLNDEAAADMLRRINAAHSAIATLDRADLKDPWLATLTRLACDESDSLHGLISGRSHRLLFDEQKLTGEILATSLSRSLSRAADPQHGAAWLEGFLSGSGLLLLHQPALWSLLDQWVISLNPDHFTAILPLLRRTFSTFPNPERLQLGELARSADAGKGPRAAAQDADDDIDVQRAERVLPYLRIILGAK
jgi:hypothetical protein